MRHPFVICTCGAYKPTLPSAGGETSGTATPLKIAEQRLDEVMFETGYPASHPMLTDWATVKFALRDLAAARSELETIKESHDELLEFKRQCDAEGFIPASVAQLLDNTETQRDAAIAELSKVATELGNETLRTMELGTSLDQTRAELAAVKAERDKLDLWWHETQSALAAESDARKAAEADRDSESRRATGWYNQVVTIMSLLEDDNDTPENCNPIPGIKAIQKARDTALANLDACRRDSERLREALKDLMRNLSNIEVLGEWEALDMNLRSGRELRLKVDAVIEKARAALANKDAACRLAALTPGQEK